MRRFISLILCLLMVFSLCACSKSSQPEVAEVETPMKVGFIYLHSETSTYDLNFINAAKEACEAAGVECINKLNIAESQDCYEAAIQLVDMGCSIIFADSFGHEDYMIQAAKENPEVQFCHATGTKAHTENLPNYHNAFASIYEGRYLAGIAAGMKLNEMIAAGEFDANDAVIGYVGAHPYAEVISGYTSFFLGARSVCPTATMKVVFTGSWYDEGLEKEAANMLINNGCKLISQHADSMGAPSACEDAGVPNVTYNGSTVSICPNTYIISSRINWIPYMAYIINCMKNNEPIDTDWTGTIANGAVELAEVGKNAAAGTEEAIKAAETDMLNGTLFVFDTNNWAVNGEHLTEYMANVDDDPNFEPDTNVIENGVFYESKYRSAPYFDINIDGIEILGQ